MIEKLILGTVQFGLDYGINNSSGIMSESEVTKVLEYCKASGIKSLDTAPGYGEAQKRISNFSNDFKILSKFSYNETSPSENLKQTLEDLRASCLECYSFHSPKDFLENGIHKDLITAKEEGLIKKLGISVYSQEEALSVLNDKHIDTIQIPFNLLDNYNRHGDLFKKIKENDKEIHIRSVFLQGLFFMAQDKEPLKIKPLIKEINHLRELARNSGLSMHELCLRYVFSIDEIDGVLIGVDSLAQLQSNLEVLNCTSLERSIIEEINDISVSCPALLNPQNWN
ncbi:MAG: aryl-alcohol dehydrogenase-like predicted oxidoreductase [Bacteriovoracaceae bacterium]|jgi:aryl-alcohol dehydrogenase-like predicted oxidoreductase